MVLLFALLLLPTVMYIWLLASDKMPKGRSVPHAILAVACSASLWSAMVLYMHTYLRQDYTHQSLSIEGFERD